jgi:hypothetical protein
MDSEVGEAAGTQDYQEDIKFDERSDIRRCRNLLGSAMPLASFEHRQVVMHLKGRKGFTGLCS